MCCLSCVAMTIASCSNSNGPVNRYVEIMDQMSDHLEKVNSIEDIQNIQQVVSPEEVRGLFDKYGDYKLTGEDKERIKKATDKMVRLSLGKAIEYTNLPEDMRNISESQMNLAIDAINTRIDNAETFGDLNKINLP